MLDLLQKLGDAAGSAWYPHGEGAYPCNLRRRTRCDPWWRHRDWGPSRGWRHWPAQGRSHQPIADRQPFLAEALKVWFSLGQRSPAPFWVSREKYQVGQGRFVRVTEG